MQIDNDLLNFAVKTKAQKPILRLYGWLPACVSLGRNQSDTFIDKSFLETQNIDIVRRLTGGRALLHDNEITYCYICPVNYINNGESVATSYKEISGFLVKGFKLLGINLDFPENKRPHTKFNYCMSISTGADLSYNGKKFIGSAQLRKEGYILQHGSINFDYNDSLIEQIFKEEFDRTHTTCLKDINPNIEVKDIVEALNTAFIN